MQNLQHPILSELQSLLYRHRTILTPHGAHRLQTGLQELDDLHTSIQQMGGIDAIRDAMSKTKKKTA